MIYLHYRFLQLRYGLYGGSLWQLGGAARSHTSEGVSHKGDFGLGYFKIWEGELTFQCLCHETSEWCSRIKQLPCSGTHVPNQETWSNSDDPAFQFKQVPWPKFPFAGPLCVYEIVDLFRKNESSLMSCDPKITIFPRYKKWVIKHETTFPLPPNAMNEIIFYGKPISLPKLPISLKKSYKPSILMFHDPKLQSRNGKRWFAKHEINFQIWKIVCF